MKPQRKRRLYFVAILIAGMGLTVSLAIYALGQNINLYYTPSQVAQGQAPLNHVFRMGGMVANNSIQRVPHTMQVSFVLTDYQQRINVSYNGILPTLFREGQGIIVQGKLTSPGNFVADQVLAKHDNKYMPPEIKAKLSQG